MSSDAGIDMSSSEVQRHLRAKAKLRQRAAQPRVSRASHRHDSDLPAGQHPVDRWLVLDLGQMSSCGAHDYDPWNDRMEHTITFKGLASCQNDGGTECERERVCTLTELQTNCTVGAAADTWDDFPAVDWHCVTGWSHRGLRFRGVWLHKVLEYVQPRQDWDCLYQTSADGYTVRTRSRRVVLRRRPFPLLTCCCMQWRCVMRDALEGACAQGGRRGGCRGGCRTAQRRCLSRNHGRRRRNASV